MQTVSRVPMGGDVARDWGLALAWPGSLGTPGQAAHSSNRRMISMSLHPNRMREPNNMKGTP